MNKNEFIEKAKKDGEQYVKKITVYTSEQKEVFVAGMMVQAEIDFKELEKLIKFKEDFEDTSKRKFYMVTIKSGETKIFFVENIIQSIQNSGFKKEVILVKKIENVIM